ncbi:Chitin synthase, class 1 [Tulasnella sp. 418]|nr:Chitin synthase, class 1 [Tulasnella sp. 418]
MARRKPAPSLDSFQQRSTVLSAPNLSLPALVSDMEDPQYQLQEQPGQRPLPQAPQYQGGYQHQQLRPYCAIVHSHSFDSNGGNFLHVSSPAPSVVMPNQVPPVFQHPQPDLLGARIPSYGNRYQVQSQYDIEKQDYYAPQVHTPRPATAYSERYAPPSIDYGHYAPQRADYYENTSSYSQWDVDSTYATDMGDKEESLTYNEDPDVVQRFGVPPEAPLARRRKKKRKVVLTEGNLVLDLPIPEKLMLGSNNAPEEMTSVRYTAVTCDADDFEAERYSLRQNWSGRETELMIGITMFNEDEVLLTRTLYGVMQGISHLCSRKNSKTWGHEAWKKVGDRLLYHLFSPAESTFSGCRVHHFGWAQEYSSKSVRLFGSTRRLPRRCYEKSGERQGRYCSCF